jgi:hypothetical protein
MRIWAAVKSGLYRFVPVHINDPVGLVRRMLTTRNRAALFTLWLTVLSIAMSPLDWILQRVQRRLSPGKPAGPVGPHVFVCGPARSGTTLVYQVLASALPVAYPRNFTALFSRSALLASRLFTRNRPDRRRENYENYYGKTAGMQAPSEANHLWNQWVDSDQSGFRTILEPRGADEMATYFQQLSAQSGLPTLTKNNNINAFADVIADRLDNAWFICLRRDNRYLAQSLVRAREEINGDIDQNYGVTDEGVTRDSVDPVDEVVRQVEYLDNLAVEQQRKIGAERFWIVRYEDFCADPSALANRIRHEILGQSPASDEDTAAIPTIRNNNRITDPVRFRQLEKRLKSRTA